MSNADRVYGHAVEHEQCSWQKFDSVTFERKILHQSVRTIRAHAFAANVAVPHGHP